MRHLEADADLGRVLEKYLLVGDHDKTGGVIHFVIDAVHQHRKPVNLCRIGAADRRLGGILVFQDLLCRNRRIDHADLLPVRILVQKTGSLHQGFRLGIDPPDLIQVRPRKSGQSMPHRKDRLSYDIVFKFHQKVIDLCHRSRRRILDRQHRIIRRSVLDGLHGVPEGPHMEVIAAFPKIFQHGRLSVGAFYSLIDYTGRILFQGIDPDEGQLPQGPCLHHLLVLQLPAHGHELLV